MLNLASLRLLSPLKKSARLSIQKTLITAAFLFFLGVSWAQAQFTLGQTLAVTITFTAGPTAWSSVTVTDSFPSDLTYNSCAGAPCSENSDTVSWIVGNVAAGQAVTLSYDFTITSCSTNTQNISGANIIVGSPSAASSITNGLSFTIICDTDTPTLTATTTATSTSTNTFTVTDTSTITQTPTVTATLTSTGTPTLTPTNTDTSTPTNTATITDTFTATGTPTNTATVTPTGTPTDTCTVTPTFSPTPTFTPTCVTYVWPDPYNPKTAVGNTLRISCMNAQSTVLIYSVSGELIRTLDQNASCQVPDMWGMVYCWDGRNKNGYFVSSGIYIYVVEQNNRVTQRGKFLMLNGT